MMALQQILPIIPSYLIGEHVHLASNFSVPKFTILLLMGAFTFFSTAS